MGEFKILAAENNALAKGCFNGYVKRSPTELHSVFTVRRAGTARLAPLARLRHVFSLRPRLIVFEPGSTII